MLLDGVSERLNRILEDAGITTIDALRALSRDEILAINGIGPVAAGTIWAALTNPPAPAVDMSTGQDDTVTVINRSGGLVLVGERYIFPNQTRMIRRDQVRAGLTILGE